MTHRTTARKASVVVAALALFSIPVAAQNPSAPAPAPRPAMACDSACRANQGGMMGQMQHQMPMGQTGQSGQMDHNMMGNSGGMMMACPMMPMMMQRMGGQGGQGGQGQGGMMGGMMGNMGGMSSGQGGQGMAGMQHGAMGAGADTAAVRTSAEQHATFIRAYYQALVGKGFTAEQALRIITSQPMPGGR